jgi:hypothetical protein
MEPPGASDIAYISVTCPEVFFYGSDDIYRDMRRYGLGDIHGDMQNIGKSEE